MATFTLVKRGVRDSPLPLAEIQEKAAKNNHLSRSASARRASNIFGEPGRAAGSVSNGASGGKGPSDPMKAGASPSSIQTTSGAAGGSARQPGQSSDLQWTTKC